MPNNTITISVLSNTSGASQGLDSLSDKLDRIGSKFSTAGNIVGIGAGAIVAGLGATIKPASDLQQMVGGVQAVFGKYADGVVRDSKRAADAVGLSATQYDEFATLIGAQLKNAGTPIDQLGGKTKTLIGLGSDLAATFGGSTSDAVDALSAALKGEMDPIEKYGISLNQAMLQQQATALGLDSNSSSWTNAQKQQIILAALTKQSTDAQGQFQKQTNTVAEQQQILTAKLQNTVAKLGTAFLPMVSKVADAFLDVVDSPGFAAFTQWLSDNPQLILILVGSLVGLTGVLKTTGAVLQGFQTVQTVFGGITKGVTGVVNVAGRFRDGFQDAAAASSAFSGKAGSIGGAARTGLNAVQSMGRGAVTLATNIGTGTASLVRQGAAWTAYAAKTVAAKTAQAAVTVATKTATIAQWAMNAALNANPIGLLITGIALLVAGLVWFFTQTQLGRDIVTAVWSGIQAAIDALVGWFQNTALPLLQATWALVVAAFEKAKESVTKVIGIILDVIVKLWSYSPLGLIVTNWGAIMSFFGSIPGKVSAVFSAAVNWLVGAGRSILDGLNRGAQAGYSAVAGWLGGMASRVLGAIGDAGSFLYRAGSNVVNGFLNGLKSMWSSVQSWFRKLTDAIPSWKGPEGRDKTLLTNAGSLIMGGLVTGLQKGRDGVRRTLGDVTDMIAGSLDGAAGDYGFGSFDLSGASPRVVLVSATVQAPPGSSGAEIGRTLQGYLDEWKRKNGGDRS